MTLATVGMRVSLAVIGLALLWSWCKRQAQRRERARMLTEERAAGVSNRVRHGT